MNDKRGSADTLQYEKSCDRGTHEAQHRRGTATGGTVAESLEPLLQGTRAWVLFQHYDLARHILEGGRV